MLSLTLFVMAALTLAAYTVGMVRGRSFLTAGPARSVHSLPSYHGFFVAAFFSLPALGVLLLWLALQGAALDHLILASLPDSFTDAKTPSQLDLVLSEIKQVARGRVFGQPGPEVLAAAERLSRWQGIARASMVGATAGVGLLVGGLGYARLGARFRARNRFERVLTTLMLMCATVAILTTVGIVASLFFEALRFFEKVPLNEFLFGLRWEPQIAIRADQVAGTGAWGFIPVFAGTLLIAGIAMALAFPIGLFSAIYLSEYSSESVRGVVKPLMEILAGVPTVVYGFFAVLTVAPALAGLGERLGLDVAPNTALAAGGVMGIMIIPFISSFSDDAFRAAPQSLRDGSYALGATKAETIWAVLFPAALPGIVGGTLLAVSRAIGETMIVVMAAGLIARLTANPLEGVTTVTVQIVTLLIGDTEFDNPKTLAAFALGLVLFLITLILNVIALRVVQRYREKYE